MGAHREQHVRACSRHAQPRQPRARPQLHHALAPQHLAQGALKEVNEEEGAVPNEEALRGGGSGSSGLSSSNSTSESRSSFEWGRVVGGAVPC